VPKRALCQSFKADANIIRATLSHFLHYVAQGPLLRLWLILFLLWRRRSPHPLQPGSFGHTISSRDEPDL
jgi:hypothetical protein